MDIIDFRATKCKHCYKCVRHCGVKAIMVKNEKAEIMTDHCILCGKCIQVCPQNAKRLNSDLNIVKKWIANGEVVVVSIAPSYVGILEHQCKEQVHTALLQLGFSKIRETAEGAAMVTQEYAKILEAHSMQTIITTCCPSVNELIEKYYPSLIPYLAPVVTPMVAHGRLLKQEYGSDIKTVFLGPCIAKKRESNDERYNDAIDAVLNFDDITTWLDDKHIDINECEPTPFESIDSKINALYPVSNGVISSVLATQNQKDPYRKFYVHGEENCIDLCENLQNGELQNCFIEMNMCTGGCIKGPALFKKTDSRFKIKLDMQDNIPNEPAESKAVAEMIQKVKMDTVFHDRTPDGIMPTEEQLNEILHMTGKSKPEHHLNCGACGYPTCREKAIAVFQKKAEPNMCIPFLYEKSQSLSNLVLQTSPNIILILDKELKIIEYSAIGEKYFGKTRAEALTMYAYELVDTTDFQWVLDMKQNIHSKKVNYPEYDLSTLQNIVYIQESDAVLVTIIDISKDEAQAQLNYEKNLETIELAQKVIQKQMMVAQEIAGLLGETTAETKTTLTTLCHSLLDDGDVGGK